MTPKPFAKAPLAISIFFLLGFKGVIFTATAQNDSAITVKVVDTKGNGIVNVVVFVVDSKMPCVCGDSTISPKLIKCIPNVIVTAVTDKGGNVKFKTDKIGPNRKIKLSLDPDCTNNSPCGTAGVAKDCSYSEANLQEFTTNDAGGYNKGISLTTSDTTNFRTLFKGWYDPTRRFDEWMYTIDTNPPHHIPTDKIETFTLNKNGNTGMNPYNIAPRQQGFIQVLTSMPFKYSDQNTTSDGKKTASDVKYDIDLGAMYFLKNGIGLGADMRFGGTKDVTYETSGSFTEKKTDWRLNADVGYIFKLSPSVYPVLRLNVGYGQINNHTEAGSTLPPTENVMDYGAEFGFPIRTCRHTSAYVEPFVRFEYLTTTYSGYNQQASKFGAGVRVDNFIFPEQFRSSISPVIPFYKDWYDQGKIYIGFGSSTCFGFGNETTKITNPTATESFKYDKSDIGLNFNGGYFLLNYLSVGLTGDLKSSGQKLSDGSDKETKFSFSVGPDIRYHIPVQNYLSNIFGDASYLYGESTTKTTTTSQTITEKENISSYRFGLGLNTAITPSVGLENGIYYNHSGIKNSGSSPDQDRTGLIIYMRVNLVF